MHDRLRDDLGVVPMARLQALQTAILRHDTARVARQRQRRCHAGRVDRRPARRPRRFGTMQAPPVPAPLCQPQRLRPRPNHSTCSPASCATLGVTGPVPAEVDEATAVLRATLTDQAMLIILDNAACPECRTRTPPSSPWTRRQRRSSRARRSTSSRTCAPIGGRPGQPGKLQRRLHRRRCSASRAAGVTMPCRHSRRGRCRTSAQSTTRSGQVSYGRATSRRKIATSRRTTSSPASSAGSPRVTCANQPNSQIAVRQSSPTTTVRIPPDSDIAQFTSRARFGTAQVPYPRSLGRVRWESEGR